MISELICALVLTAMALRITTWLAAPWRALVAGVTLLVSLLPFPWGLSGWVLSYLSDFSITTGLLALVAIQHRLTGHYSLPVRELRASCLTLVVLALWFYPMSLGSSYADPYALGFGDTLLSGILLLVGLFAWLSRAYASCLLLVAAQVAFRFNLLQSDNLWDYLIDPWLVSWASGWLIRDRLLRVRENRAERLAGQAVPAVNGAKPVPIATASEG
tara:strand:- start:40401 stop:41048 length:648 start_codon:yes stop_codon:yes gene_type:complete